MLPLSAYAESNTEMSPDKTALTLDDVESIAIENSLDIDIARAIVEKSEVNVRDEEKIYEDYKGNTFNMDMVQQINGLMIMNEENYNIAVMQLELDEKNIMFTEDKIKIEAINYYYDVIYKKENASIKEMMLKINKDKLDELNLKYELGNVASVELEKAENNYKNVLMDYEDALMDYDFSIKNLNAFLGYDYETETEVIGNLTCEYFSTELAVQEMIENAKDNSYSYQSAVLNLQKKRIFSEYTHSGTYLGKEALADTIIAESTTLNIAKDIELSIYQTLNDFVKLENNIDRYTRELQQIKNTIEMKETKYTMGLISSDELDIEYNNLQQSNLNLSTAKKNYCIKKIEFQNMIK